MIVERADASGRADRVDTQDHGVDGHRADLGDALRGAIHESDRRLQGVSELIAAGRLRFFGIVDQLEQLAVHLAQLARILGVIAVIGLAAYGTIFFALIKLIPITLTLPGIAGLVLTIGVAADANIVIFERIKEEIRAGRSIPAGIAAGYKKGFSTIVDANVVTIMTAFILFILATAGVKGFAFTLGLGVIVWLVVRWVRSRPSAPPPSATAIALRELEKLRDRVREMEPYAFTVAVSEVLRTFISDAKFRLPATRQTSPEFLAAIADSPMFSADDRTLLGHFLEKCDMIKFARLEATSDDNVELVGRALDFVQGGRA